MKAEAVREPPPPPPPPSITHVNLALTLEEAQVLRFITGCQSSSSLRASLNGHPVKDFELVDRTNYRLYQTLDDLLSPEGLDVDV